MVEIALTRISFTKNAGSAVCRSGGCGPAFAEALDAALKPAAPASGIHYTHLQIKVTGLRHEVESQMCDLRIKLNIALGAPVDRYTDASPKFAAVFEHFRQSAVLLEVLTVNRPVSAHYEREPQRVSAEFARLVEERHLKFIATFDLEGLKWRPADRLEEIAERLMQRLADKQQAVMPHGITGSDADHIDTARTV